MPAIVSRFYVAPAVSGNPDKVWLRCQSGEGGDFCRHEFEAVLGAGLECGQVDEMLERFFWENF